MRRKPYDQRGKDDMNIRELNNMKKTKLDKIAEIANNVLYFMDNSDYSCALWDILRIARPDLWDGEDDAPKEKLKYMKELD